MFLPDEYTNSGPARQPPVLANKVQLGLYVVDEQCHVVGEVEVAHLKHQRVTQHCLPTHPVNLARHKHIL